MMHECAACSMHGHIVKEVSPILEKLAVGVRSVSGSGMCIISKGRQPWHNHCKYKAGSMGTQETLTEQQRLKFRGRKALAGFKH